MSSSQKAKITLALALTLLVLSGISAGFAILRLHRAESLVRHTYDVEVAMGDLESSLANVGRYRVDYINAATPPSPKAFENAVNNVAPVLAKIRQLTRDNPAQQALCDRLEDNVKARLAVSWDSIKLKEQNQIDIPMQLQFTSHLARISFDSALVAEQMRHTEDALLQQRSRLSSFLFTAILGILTVTLLLSAILFWLHYRLLSRELQEREAAEGQLRQLSVQLMQVQDQEHRRFARELHDGLGQNLAAAKMMAESLRAGDPLNSRAAELTALLGDALSQTRTISHLFHPPLLDEIGFPSAATWLIEGYAQRTGIVVSANIPHTPPRLPQTLELTLFRVLQEALNNIHAHSKASKVEVYLEAGPKAVTLRIKDYGRGIPSEKLAALHTGEVPAGVGLLSMKERVREQHGTLEIRSHATGTEIVVRIPFDSGMGSSRSAAAKFDPGVLSTEVEGPA